MAQEQAVAEVLGKSGYQVNLVGIIDSGIIEAAEGSPVVHAHRSAQDSKISAGVEVISGVFGVSP